MRRPVLGVLFGGCGLGANPGGLSEFCRILVIESEYPYVVADGERNWVRTSVLAPAVKPACRQCSGHLGALVIRRRAPVRRVLDAVATSSSAGTSSGDAGDHASDSSEMQQQ